METLKAIEARKSVRGYLEKEVEAEKVQEVVKAGFLAPNAGPVFFTVIKDRNLLDKIDENAKAAALASGNDFLVSRYSLPGYSASYGAPIVIIVSAPEGPFSGVNAACCITNMGIAAADLGLGTCFMAGMMGAFKLAPELIAELKAPKGFAPQFGITLGYASDKQIEGVRNDQSANVCIID